MKYKVEYRGLDLDTIKKEVDTLDEVINFAKEHGNTWISKEELKLSFDNNMERYISIFPNRYASILVEVITQERSRI